MTFVDWPGTPFAPVWLAPAASSTTGYAASVAMDAAGEEIGWVVEAPKTGTLKAIGFATSNVSNNPDNGLRAAFYSLASGLPAVETHFRVVPSPITSNTFFTTGIISDDGTDTGTKKSVTRGEKIAIAVSFESFVVGDNLNISQSVRSAFVGCGITRGFPYGVQDTGTGWIKSSPAGDGTFAVALQYDDDVWYPIIGCLPASSFPTAIALNSSSNPREAGNSFSLPVPLRCAGFQLIVTFASLTTSTFDVRLYNNGVLAQTKSFGPGNTWGQGTANGAAYHGWFETSTELAATVTHELTIVGTGVGNVTVFPIAFASAALKAASMLDSSYSRITAATAGGVRTTTATQQIVLVPVFDGIDPIKGGESVGVDSWSPVLFGEEWY